MFEAQNSFLVASPDVIERLERAALRHARGALENAAAIPGNPLAVEVHDRAGATAHLVGALPMLPWYNNIICRGAVQTSDMEALLALYSARGIALRVTTWTTMPSPSLENFLAHHGFVPRGAGATLFAVPGVGVAASASGVTVRLLAPGEEVDCYNGILNAGYGHAHPAQQALAILEHGHPAVHRYLAYVDGEPAAIAAMVHHDGIAYLAGATTLPAFRKRGAQTALIQRRLADAAPVATMAAVTSAFDSPSQRHLEQCGFRLGHVKTLWGARSEEEDPKVVALAKKQSDGTLKASSIVLASKPSK